MSIMQDYENIRKDLGFKYDAIEDYLNVVSPPSQYKKYEEELKKLSSLDYENFDSFGYVKVHAAGNLTTRGVLISINAFEKLEVSGAKQIYEILNNQTDYHDGGYYKVGVDIPAGQYVLESYGSGYWAVMTGPVGSSDIVDNEKKNLRNKETNIIAFFFVGLFLATIVYLCIFNVKDAGTIVNNPYNKRVDNQESKVVRGDILADDGDVLATTLTDEDGNETRYYPYDNLFCHSVGFTSLTGMKTGIEQSQNYFLLSETDNVLDQIGNDLSGGKAKGHNVTTTLNVELTKAAYKALGNNKGAVIAMEPATGKILAMVSNPSFDANAVNTDYDEWITYDSADSVLLNRATQGLYPPGSTFKIITALAYIRQNQNDYYNYSYNCDGQAYISGGTTIACFDHTAHGYQDLRKAFANSCNSAFSTIGAGLNKTSFMNLCSTLLFNSNLPVGFEYSKSTMAVTQDSSISEMQETGIGQGRTMMTPLHNMMIAASVANDGVMMTPYIVDSISDSEGRTVVKNKPAEEGTVMSAEEAEYLTECMREVITSGTGNSMKYSSYEAAGKTGSAQYDDSDRYHSWFTGFAPYDNPQIAVCVILEGGYSGVSSAQVVAKAVFDTYFGY